MLAAGGYSVCFAFNFGSAEQLSGSWGFFGGGVKLF